jgi:hypothetical protein
VLYGALHGKITMEPVFTEKNSLLRGLTACDKNQQIKQKQSKKNDSFVDTNTLTSTKVRNKTLLKTLFTITSKQSFFTSETLEPAS